MDDALQYFGCLSYKITGNIKQNNNVYWGSEIMGDRLWLT